MTAAEWEQLQGLARRLRALATATPAGSRAARVVYDDLAALQSALKLRGEIDRLAERLALRDPSAKPTRGATLSSSTDPRD